MATGVIRIDDNLTIEEVQLKIPRRSSSHASNDRSSSGVSSECNSPSSIQLPSTDINSYSSPVAEETGYSNPALEEDNDDQFRSAPAVRQGCTGVLSVHDELCIDFSDHLPEDLRPPTKITKQATRVDDSLLKRAHNYLHSKWRSLPVSMIPLKPGVDQKPLSPSTPDLNGNNKRAPVASGSTSATSPAPENRAAAVQRVPEQPNVSCLPAYVFIIVVLFFLLVFSGISTVINMRPAFLYGHTHNDTWLETNSTSNLTLLD